MSGKLVPECVRNFAETPYIHPQNGQTYRLFAMPRDGFTLLAMGFTGKNGITPAIRKTYGPGP
jgi:phage regulator Rha-like protein